MTTAITKIESLATQLEKEVYNPYPIGFCRGVKSAVLHLRKGEDLNSIVKDEQERRKLIHGSNDVYDRGYIDGLLKAVEILKDGDTPTI